jgi:UV excision repair protein RAD23
MKLTIKSLKQVPYEVEVEDDQSTIKELKQQVEKLHGFDHTTLKLVFNGVVLDDSKKLAECNIKEGNVIVMMNAKAKPQNVQKEEVKKEENVPKTTNNTTTNITGQTTTQNLPSQSTSSVQQKDYSQEVKTLMEFGFPKPECEAAIRAAKGNVNVATEFLLNGIPEGLPIDDNSNPSSSVDPNSPTGVLKNIASVVKIICYNNPSQLQSILLNLQQTSPEIMDLIRENEEEFRNLISQPITDDDLRAFREFSNQARGEAGLEPHGSEGESQGAQGRNVIKLTKQDYDAVSRLKELGFSEMDAVQAFFACDKNEDAAANFLWENKLKDQDQEMYIDCKLTI